MMMMGRGAVNTGNSRSSGLVFLSDLEADFCFSDQIPGFILMPRACAYSIAFMYASPVEVMTFFPPHEVRKLRDAM